MKFNKHNNIARIATIFFTALSVSILLLPPRPANALGGGKAEKLSLEVFKKCKPTSIPKLVFCSALAAAADPPSEGITDISISLKYNPSEWIFRPNLSGFLCDFSVSGGCPPTNASVGNFLLKDIPELNFNPGDPLPGSTFLLDNDDVNGLVTLSYHLDEPLASSGEQNFFLFYFDAVTPLIESQTTIEFFNQPGNYNFTQTNSSCTAINNGTQTNCGSNTPITGFNVYSVPEPSTILSSLFFGFFLLLKRKYKMK